MKISNIIERRRNWKNRRLSKACESLSKAIDRLKELGVDDITLHCHIVDAVLAVADEMMHRH